MTMDFGAARFNMIEQQIRPWDVLDPRVLDLIARTPREAFVPEKYQTLAFADIEIPLDHGEVMMAPKIEARLLQALDVHPTDVILEIGTGSGYLTALLAQLGRHVYSIDIHPDFVESAHRKLEAQGIRNVTLEIADGAQGWDKHAPYDVIVLTGSVPQLPETLPRTLQRAGRLFAVVGDAPVMEAVLITRTGDSEFRRETVFETVLPPLANIRQPSRFVF